MNLRCCTDHGILKSRIAKGVDQGDGRWSWLGTAQAKVGKWRRGGGAVRPGNWSALVCLEREAWKQIVVSWEPRLSWTGEAWKVRGFRADKGDPGVLDSWLLP